MIGLLGEVMKQRWTEDELIEHFTVSLEESDLLKKRTPAGRLGFALLLKIHEYEGRFPSGRHEIPHAVVAYIARQLSLSPQELDAYHWHGREAKQQRTTIRKMSGFRKWSRDYVVDLVTWLRQSVLPQQFTDEHLREAARQHLRGLKIESPEPVTFTRMLHSAMKTWEDHWFHRVANHVSDTVKHDIDALLSGTKPESTSRGQESDEEEDATFRELKADPGKVSLKTIAEEASKLKRMQSMVLPSHAFKGIPLKLLRRYRDRVITEPAREMRRHPPHIRYARFAIFVSLRSQEITDALVDLLIHTVHRIGARAEKKVAGEMMQALKKVSGKDDILFRMASAAWEHPDEVVKEVIFPVVGEETLQHIIREYASSGSAYTRTVTTKMHASYRGYYRRMLPLMINALEFRSNNQTYRPIIQAIELLRTHADSPLRYYPEDEEVPCDGIIPGAWKDLVYEVDGNGHQRIQRMAYELCVFGALRDKLRCKDVWVVGADRYRNPDDDLPDDFDQNRTAYYAALRQPLEVKTFLLGLQQGLEAALKTFDQGLPHNPDVEILKKQKGWIKLSPLEAQTEPQNLARLRTAISHQWQSVNLLDVLKETDLRVKFSDHFTSVAQRECLDRATLQKRLLLALYALGTNAGFNRVAAGDHGETYHDLMYVKRRFLRKEALRQANASVVNAILAIRLPHLWGDTTTACAGDSTRFRAWDQNLLTEWHARYGGRGIMIYWHVERKAACIYSQLKTCSSSEVAAMIEGVMRHCTEMDVDTQYVDTHGQSFVAFAFCHLLGFKLLPRLKGMHAKKLYRPSAGSPDAYPNIQPVLTRPIRWELIQQQYEQMVKFATAIRLGTADTEAILRRFTQENLKHPTYQALLELGRAVRTIFLCEYLSTKALRREIQEGLNVIELWNGVNDFIFFGKGGELATNRRESQESSILSLHLLQNCLVYINTLMIQQVLKDANLMRIMTADDLRGLTPLMFHHINPYGTFRLDMTMRLPLDEEAA